jgi:hypothetical protein
MREGTTAGRRVRKTWDPSFPVDPISKVSLLNPPSSSSCQWESLQRHGEILFQYHQPRVRLPSCNMLSSHTMLPRHAHELQHHNQCQGGINSETGFPCHT